MLVDLKGTYLQLHHPRGKEIRNKALHLLLNSDKERVFIMSSYQYDKFNDSDWNQSIEWNKNF